jgi:anaphase-promoting complex subunit 4
MILAESHLVSLPYRHNLDSRFILPWSEAHVSSSILPNDESVQIESHWTLTEQEDLERYTLHTFHLDKDSFKPLRMEVNGRKNRRTCVVIGEDHRQVRVYDLGDSSSGFDGGVDSGAE